MAKYRVCLTHGSADELLEAFAASGAELQPSGLQARDFSPDVEPLIEAIDELLGKADGRLSVLVGASEDKRSEAKVVSHRFFGELPGGSILHVDEGIYVASPCFNLLLEARELHLVNLCCMLGRYLGTFSLEKGAGGDTFVNRVPLTSDEELGLYLSHFSRTAGLKKLHDALRFTCGNAASPQEVNLQLALCLPPSCNGYALKKPLMNHPIKLGPDERKIYDAEHIRIDLYWPQVRFGLEYQGEEEHKNQMSQDISRWYAARRKGIELWFVTKEQLGSAEQMDFIAREVAKRTRKKINEETWPTIGEAQRLLDVLRGGKWLNLHEELRQRPIRTRRNGA